MDALLFSTKHETLLLLLFQISQSDWETFDAMDTKFIELVKKAILALDEGNGCSATAIMNHIEANKGVPEGTITIKANQTIHGATKEWVKAVLKEGLERGIVDQVGTSHYKVFYQLPVYFLLKLCCRDLYKSSKLWHVPS